MTRIVFALLALLMGLAGCAEDAAPPPSDVQDNIERGARRTLPADWRLTGYSAPRCRPDRCSRGGVRLLFTDARGKVHLLAPDTIGGLIRFDYAPQTLDGDTTITLRRVPR